MNTHACAANFVRLLRLVSDNLLGHAKLYTKAKSCASVASHKPSHCAGLVHGTQRIIHRSHGAPCTRRAAILHRGRYPSFCWVWMVLYLSDRTDSSWGRSRSSKRNLWDLSQSYSMVTLAMAAHMHGKHFPRQRRLSSTRQPRQSYVFRSGTGPIKGGSTSSCTGVVSPYFLKAPHR